MMASWKYLAAWMAVLPWTIWAQEPAGTLKSLRGQAVIERDGAKRTARAGDSLMPRDRILTSADGYVSLGLRDQSSIAIGPNSDVDLSKYSFNPTTHQGEQQVRLRSGSLAAISGKLAKASPDAVQFNAGSVTLGVRGTRFVAEVQSGQSDASFWRDSHQQLIRSASGLCWKNSLAEKSCPTDIFILLPDRNGEVGAITLKRDGSSMLVNKAYSVGEVTDTQMSASVYSPAQVDVRFGPLLSAMPPAPRTFVIRFAAGSADELAPGSQAVIQQIRDVLMQWPMLPSVDVVGHTDTTGEAAQNDELSLQRALAVTRRLASFALPADRLHVSGRGERQLLVPTPDETHEPLNRRVEITVY